VGKRLKEIGPKCAFVCRTQVQDLSGWEVKVLSPDVSQPQFAGLSLHGSVCEVTLNRIEHYAAVTLSTRPVP
jgi:hypothetical protein